MVIDSNELLAMGFTEVLGRLPRILRAVGEVADAAAKERPDIAIVLDYGGFHFRLAKRLRSLKSAASAKIPLIYFIPPKVWAWRQGRARFLAHAFERVLCILPFEQEFLHARGVNAEYVGSPLIDEIPQSLLAADARARMRAQRGFLDQDLVVTIMPGSRPAEIRDHTALLLDSVQRAAALLRSKGHLPKGQRLRVCVPFPVQADAAARDRLTARVVQWLRGASGGQDLTGDASQSFILDIRVSFGDSAECLAAADAALIKSGTSTLEAAYIGCRHALLYRPGWITTWIFDHVVRYRGPVGLGNLVLGEAENGNGVGSNQTYPFREILRGDANPQKLSDELVALLTDPVRQAQQDRALAEVRRRLTGSHRAPSQRAAEVVFEVLGQQASQTSPQTSSHSDHSGHPGRGR